MSNLIPGPKFCAAAAMTAFLFYSWTLRRMLHKAEEWNLLGKVPKFKLLREHGRRLRLDDDAEQRLLGRRKRLQLEAQ